MCTASKYATIHEVLEEKKNTISVNQLCKIAHVSRSGYYRWRNAEGKREEKQKRDEIDFKIIFDKQTGVREASSLSKLPSCYFNRRAIPVDDLPRHTAWQTYPEVSSKVIHSS